MLTTFKLNGTEPQLYQLVAPLVMSPAVLRFNHNYPFKTGKNYTWYIATLQEQVVGFVPVENRSGKQIINNYYTKSSDTEEILSQLIDFIIADMDNKTPLSAVVQSIHQQIFAKKNFKTIRQWKLYVKMELTR